jgi:hypothetical protein
MVWGRTLRATREAPVEQNPCEVPGVARPRRAVRKDVKLECERELTEDRLGIQRELWWGGFWGFLSGNRRARGPVPKWEARPDLGKPPAVSLWARGFARFQILARAPRKLLLSASGQDSCLGSHETILSSWREGD